MGLKGLGRSKQMGRASSRGGKSARMCRGKDGRLHLSGRPRGVKTR